MFSSPSNFRLRLPIFQQGDIYLYSIIRDAKDVRGAISGFGICDRIFGQINEERNNSSQNVDQRSRKPSLTGIPSREKTTPNAFLRCNCSMSEGVLDLELISGLEKKLSVRSRADQFVKPINRIRIIVRQSRPLLR